MRRVIPVLIVWVVLGLVFWGSFMFFNRPDARRSNGHDGAWIGCSCSRETNSAVRGPLVSGTVALSVVVVGISRDPGSE